MVRHKLISVKTWLQDHRALLVTLATALVVLSFVLPMRSLLEQQAFVRSYATELLGSVGANAVIVVGDTGSRGSGAEIATLTELQQREGMRPDVRIIMNDITVGEDNLTASTAAIFREPQNAGRPIYLTYAIDQLNPDWHTRANGYLYLLEQEGMAMMAISDAGTVEFPGGVQESEIVFRGFISLASYRYAAYLQETAGKEAALPHLLRAIEYDDREGSVTYQGYTARRQALIDRGGIR